MKLGLKKKAFKILQQKSFQCDIPETTSLTKTKGCMSPKSLSSSQGYYARGPQSYDLGKGQNQVKRILTGWDRVRNSLRMKNSENMRSTPQLGGLLRSDSLSPITQRFRVSLQNPEESIEMLVKRLRELQNVHRTEVSTLKVIISSLKRKFNSNQNQSQKDTQTSRSSTQNQDMADEISRLRGQNQKLQKQQERLIQELNQMAKARSFQKEMLNMECSRLKMEISSLKIKIMKMDESVQLESPNSPKICHIFSYPQYDHSKEQMPERISEIESKYQISNARVNDIMECEYFTKCGRLNNTMSSGVKIRYAKNLSPSKIRKQEIHNVQIISSSVSANSISLLEIDSKDSSSSR